MLVGPQNFNLILILILLPDTKIENVIEMLYEDQIFQIIYYDFATFKKNQIYTSYYTSDTPSRTIHYHMIL